MANIVQKIPIQIKILLLGLMGVIIFSAAAGAMWLLHMLIILMLDKTWVASLTLLGIFLIVILFIKGWTAAGTLVFMVAVLVGAIMDIPGNPIYNAPFETLFLEEGEYLTGRASVVQIAGSSAASGSNIVVDGGGNYIRDISGFSVFLYRVVLYSIIFGTLLTLRGFVQKLVPAKKKAPKGTASKPGR